MQGIKHTFTTRAGMLEWAISRDIINSRKRRARVLTGRGRERQQAKRNGEIHYSTSKPCLRGHLSKRFTITGQCLQCYSDVYNKRYLPLRAAITARRRAKEGHATPPWLTAEHWLAIKLLAVKAEFYTKEFHCKYHVDHIVPIKGKLVCGLHVPWNMQILQASVNIRKSNKFII